MAIMNSPILLALLAAIFYGIGGPWMNWNIASGASGSAVMFSYGLACVVLALWWPGNPITFGGVGMTISTLALGISFAVAFLFILQAFSLQTASITLILVLVASYPLLSTFIEVVFIKTPMKSVPLTVCGAILVISGVILISLNGAKPH